ITLSNNRDSDGGGPFAFCNVPRRLKTFRHGHVHQVFHGPFNGTSAEVATWETACVISNIPLSVAKCSPTTSSSTLILHDTNEPGVSPGIKGASQNATIARVHAPRLARTCLLQICSKSACLLSSPENPEPKMEMRLEMLDVSV
uniref:Uncharacterized protein n=1 Tax=Gasterosteus aculeatus TaxID=69293 RepID=G3Q3Q2_GASAC